MRIYTYQHKQLKTVVNIQAPSTQKANLLLMEVTKRPLEEYLLISVKDVAPEIRLKDLKI